MSRDNLINRTILLGILILAYSLRVYKIGGIFHNWDSAVLPSLVMESKNILWVLFHSYGFFTPFISEIFSRILLFFNVPMTEFWWVYPISLTGTLTVLVIYFLIKVISDSKKALFVSLVVGFLSSHVITSRYAYGYECGYVFLAFLSVYFFIKYLKSNNKIDGILFSLVLSAYILTHVLFLFIFLILFWAATVCTVEKGSKKQLNIELKKIFLNKIFILPVFCVLLEVIFTAIYFTKDPNILKSYIHSLFNPGTSIHYYTQTMLGHHILRAGWLSIKPFDTSVGDLILSNGISFWSIWFYFILLSIPFGIKDVWRRSEDSVFFVWGALYAIPFLLIEFICSVRMQTYVSFGLVPMSIYTALLIYEKTYSMLSYFNRKLRVIFFCVILSSIGFYLFFESCYKVFQFDVTRYAMNTKKPFLEEPFKYRNAFYFDVGYKTAGYYVRTYVDNELNIYIYDLDYRVFLENFYLGRTVLYSGESYAEAKKIFEEKANIIDVIVALPESKKYFDTFPQFEIKSKIFSPSLNKERQLVLLIYGKKNSSLPKIDMDTQKYNVLYDNYYSFTGKSSGRDAE